MISVYIAAPLGAVERARRVAGQCASAGYLVTSRWHTEVEPDDVDPEHASQRARILLENLFDLAQAHAVVADTSEGTPRATFGEIGYALALHRRVIWIQEEGATRCLFDAHPLVVIVPNVEAAIDAVARAC